MLPSISKKSFSSSRAILFAVVFFLTLCNILHEVKSGRSLSLQQQPNERHRRSPNLINYQQEAAADELDGSSSHRRKRDISSNKNLTDSRIKTSVTKLQDSKTQLVYFWAGQDVILCLARDVNANASSTLYISSNYGETFTNVSNLLLANINGKGTVQPILEKFINHPKHNGHFAFSDIKNKLLYTTRDYGVTFNYTVLSFTPDQILFDPSSETNIVIHEESAKEKTLWASKDSGRTFTAVQKFVKSVSWDESGPSKIYIEREEPNNSNTVLSSNSMFLTNDTQVVETEVDEFQIKDNKYMFVTKKGKDTLKLFVSYNRGPFKPAIFPNKMLSAKHFHVADVSDGQMFVCVIHNESLTNLYIGNEPLDSKESPKFSLSLERIVFFKPNLTWSDSWLNDVTDNPFVDLHKVEGLRGVYIASQLSVATSNSSKFDFDQIVSLITFDQGGQWELLNAPEFDDDGDPIYCRLAATVLNSRKNCSLHVSQRLSELYPLKRAVPILSKASAVGIVLATGTVDLSLKGRNLGVFMSTDGAASWKQILKGNYLYAFGDHGGIIMAVNMYKPGGATNELLYTINEGASWKKFEFYEDKVKVLGLMTEPGENSTVFTIFGSLSVNTNHSWILIKVDFKGVFERSCKDDDYKRWTPWNARPGRPCLMGRKDIYERRTPNVTCYNGLDYERLVSSENCSCKRIDFECDFGFKEDSKDVNKCIKDTSESSEGVKPEWCKPGDLYYTRTRGYRKVPGDTCVGGFEDIYLPKKLPCAISNNETEFLVVAKRDAVLRINLKNFNLIETLPLSEVGSVVALDFDKSTRTLYYSDVNKDHIKRIRLDGNSEVETLISYGLTSVEGLAFDWISKNLYFADSVEDNSKIEVFRTDATIWGRMRKKILGPKDLDKPRGIAVHPVKGYLFWTDWSETVPCIGRAELDGSNPKKIITNEGRISPLLLWPNGIAVDTEKNQIYWVDANLDHLATSDLDGNQVLFYLSKDPKMAHPFSVAVMNDYVYWTDWMTKGIYMSKKDSLNSSAIVTVVSNIPRPMEMKVFGSTSQTGQNQCSNNPCEHLCLAKPNGTSICTCPDGLLPAESGTTTCVCPDGKTPSKTGVCEHSCGDKFNFKCADSGFCIPSNWRCDGDSDCPDGSDEIGCVKSTCNVTSQFQCVSDGRCIPSIWFCDLDEDCPDGSDEKNCGTAIPPCDVSTQFQCANKRCILRKWVCDGDDDCLDGIPSDEINCKNSSALTCGPDEYKCPGEERCISEDWKCDGDHDCKDASDEQNCDNSTCASWKFHCTSGECIMTNWVCDHDPDCRDGSDEVNCTYTTTTTPTPIDPFPKGNCSGDQMYECGVSHKCIPVFWKCDGVCDCGNGEEDCSDENGCDDSKHEITTTPKPLCPKDKFQCSSGTCISRTFVCDGKPDCPDKSDEDINKCAHVDGGCKDHETQCGPSMICINKDKICDGKQDCPNNWDENTSTCAGTSWILPSPDQIVMSTKGAWGIAITIIVVIAVLVGTLGVFVVRHRRLRLSFFNFASSHYSTSSGAATFQQTMEEEHDAPIIRGFSDDEPLLVA